MFQDFEFPLQRLVGKIADCCDVGGAAHQASRFAESIVHGIGIPYGWDHGMKITIESTTKISSLNGIDCRVWEGTSERGVPVIVFIPRIMVKNTDDCTQFETELKEQQRPSVAVEAIPLRFIL